MIAFAGRMQLQSELNARREKLKDERRKALLEEYRKKYNKCKMDHLKDVTPPKDKILLIQ